MRIVHSSRGLLTALATFLIASFVVGLGSSTPATAACGVSFCVGKDPQTNCGSGTTKYYRTDPASDASGAAAYWSAKGAARPGYASGSQPAATPTSWPATRDGSSSAGTS